MPHLLLLVLISAAPSTIDNVPGARTTAPDAAAGTTAEQAPTLAQVLKALAEDERRKEASPGCSYRERTRVEELHDDGTVKGSLIRTWAITRSKTGELTRKLLSTERTGEISDMFAKDPKDPSAKERKAQRSPFHPELQGQYRFKLAAVTDKGLRVAFEPLERSDKRLDGTAFVDPARLALTSMSGAPSKLPPMVEQLELGFRYASTACGVLPVHIRVKGAGGFLFFKARFRSETWHTGHTR